MLIETLVYYVSFLGKLGPQYVVPCPRRVLRNTKWKEPLDSVGHSRKYGVAPPNCKTGSFLGARMHYTNIPLGFQWENHNQLGCSKTAPPLRERLNMAKLQLFVPLT